MTAESDLLLDKAQQNLEAARLLGNSGYLEIAASRAYYSMFYAAEAMLLARGLKFSSHSVSHRRIRQGVCEDGGTGPEAPPLLDR